METSLKDIENRRAQIKRENEKFRTLAVKDGTYHTLGGQSRRRRGSGGKGGGGVGEDGKGGGGAGDGVEEVYPMIKVRVSTGVWGRGRRRGSRRHGTEVTNKKWKKTLPLPLPPPPIPQY